jgi:Zn finger protein HypA/HybF involved in hydrogenase expression
MSSWLTLLLGVAVIVILVVIIKKKKRSGTQEDTEFSERSCKHCQKPIPIDFAKSLCPHCKGFLM